MVHTLKRDGPIGAIYGCSKNGWINEDSFSELIVHFNHFVKATTDDPVLLVLDNHGSHISLNIYEYCRANEIVLVSIPAHTSHKLQPLDLSFFGPLKAALNRECDLYLKNHAYEKIAHYELARLFNKAYLKAASMEKGISEFRAAGIWPLDSDKFSDDDFFTVDHTEVTNIQIPIDSIETVTNEMN